MDLNRTAWKHWEIPVCEASTASIGKSYVNQGVQDFSHQQKGILYGHNMKLYF